MPMLKKWSLRSLLLGILVVLSTTVYCTPILCRPVYCVLVGISIILFLLCQLGSNPIKNNQRIFVAFAFYILLTSSYRFLGLSDNAWGNSMHEYSFFLCFVSLLLIETKIKNKQFKVLYWIFIVIVAFNIGDNIVLSIMFPQINDYRPDVDENLLNSINAGDSTFYSMAVFFAGVNFFVFLNAKSKMVKLASFCATVLASVYVFGYCNKGSSVILLTLFLFLLFLVHKIRDMKKIFIYVGMSFLLVFFVVFFLKEEIVDLIISVSPSERLATRLITLIDPHNNYANEDTVSGRTNLYLLSVETWLRSPWNFLFGIGDIRDAMNPEATGIGQHSDFLDSLARYGVFGATFLVVAISKALKHIKGFFSQNQRIQISVIYFIFILTCLTKTVLVPNIAVILFVILPISSQFVNDNLGKCKKKI